MLKKARLCSWLPAVERLEFDLLLRCKAYDTASFVLECPEENVTPRVAWNITPTRGSRINGRTSSPTYAASMLIHKRTEEASAG